MMGTLQVQSNGDAAADELFPDPGYVEVDPTGRYGRVRSIYVCCSSSSSLLIFFFRHAPSCPGLVVVLIVLLSLLCSNHRPTAVQRDSRQGILKDCV